MTSEHLSTLILDAVRRMSARDRELLASVLQSGDGEDPGCCAAKVILGGESEFQQYAARQERDLAFASRRLAARGIRIGPKQRQVRGPLLEALLDAGEGVPDLWLIEAAYEGWLPSLDRAASLELLEAGLLEDT